MDQQDQRLIPNPVVPGAWSVHRQFVLSCLQGRWQADKLKTAQLLTHSLDWQWQPVLDILEREALSPLFHRILQPLPLPDAVRGHLAHAYYRNACRNMLLFRELGLLIQSFQQAEILTIVLKGAALSDLVYGDIGLRPMSDLDLLIQRIDLHKARIILAEAGYSLVGLEMRAGYTEEFRYEETWLKPGLVNTYIDLHWGLFNHLYYQPGVTTQWLWDTALNLEINQVKVQVLGYEAQVLHLCAHLCLHHTGDELMWLQDIAELIHRYPDQIDWAQLLIQVPAFHLVLPVQQVLQQLAVDWAIPIPREVMEQILALKPSAREARVFGWLRAFPLAATLRSFLADLVGAVSWPQRFRYAWNTIFPSPSYMRQRYQILSPWLTPFYYPYRWLRAFNLVRPWAE